MIAELVRVPNRRFLLELSGAAFEALAERARAERRDPREQAAVELERVFGRQRRRRLVTAAQELR